MALKKIEIVSATPGRLQLTIPALKGKLHLSKRLDNTLSTLAGIEDVVIDDVFGSVLLRYDTDDIELYLFATGLGRALRIVLGKNGISDADVAELGASLARRHEAFWIRRLLLQRREAELETQKTERRLAARAGQAKAAKAKAEQQVADAEQAKLMAEEQLRTELLMRRQAEEEAETCKQARERAEVDLQEQIQSCHHAVESLEEAQRQVAHAEQARLIAESDLETERVARRQAEDHARTCQEAREQVEANLQKQTRILQQTMEAMEKAERQAAHADQDRALRERELESEKRIRRELENEVMVSRADCERAQATVQQLSETLRQTTDALTRKTRNRNMREETGSGRARGPPRRP